MKTFSSILIIAFGLLARLASAAPTILSVNPPAGAVVSSLTQVTVTFSAAVTGVEVEDFLVNALPPDAVSGSGATRTFTFTQPGPGRVQFAWDGSHFITDLNGSRFDETAPGSIWSCTLTDTISPTVRLATPSPGAVVGALTQIEITFSEPVTGVNAGDLLVGGQPAATVTGADAGPYLFTFPQPVSGNVSIGWAGGNGIQDTAAVPNAFAGGSWNYTLNPAAIADVVINEIMADNLNGLLDDNGDASDWIELYNRGASSVNLLGWALTVDPARPGQWVFPNLTLNAGQYLLVFASGKDRTGAVTNHANFTLARSGYLGLYNAQLPRVAVHEFAPAYPEQRGDIAWGRTAANTLSYFSIPTPRAANAAATNYSGFAEQPHASVGSGLFTQAFQLALGSDTPGAAIYYTLNGSTPAPTNGTLYSGLITIAGTAAKAVIPLRAAAYKTGLLPSTVLARTYIFPDHVLSQPIRPAGFPTNWMSSAPSATATTSGDYEMDPQVLTNNNNSVTARQALTELPVVSIVASIDTLFAPTNGVYSGRRKQGNQRQINAEMWLPNGERVFQADCGLEVQGGSSPTDANGDWKDKKLSLRLIFKGDFGTPKLNAKVFDDSPVEEFNTLILDAGLNYWWTHMTDGDQRNRAKFITDTITSDLMNNAGMVAQHCRFVHLYLNGLYWGLYGLHERMDEAAAASYLGGEKEEWDVIKHDVNGLQNGTITNYNAMFALARTGLANNATYEQLQTFLDVPWFIDYMMINFWAGNTDWPHHNWYAWRRSRTPGSLPWRFVSWDAEHTIKNWDFDFIANGNLTAGSSPGELFNLLRNNAEFRVQFGDRVHKLMFNGGSLYTTPNSVAMWSAANPEVNAPATAYRKRVDEIWNSVVCESARWGDVATANANSPYTRELHYTRELNSLFTITNISGQTPNYFPLRGSNVLARLRTSGLYPSVSAPAFSQHGGRVAPGYSLFITNVGGAGTVYFTTNGTDPRSYGSGAVAPQAVTYAGGPVALGQSMTVKARTLNGTNWSALNEAVFAVGSLGVPLRITEIMYNPPGGDAHEFIELQNIGATELNLGNFSFDGITYSFPPFYTLAAGARIVLASDAGPAAFASRYPGVAVAGYFAGSLANGGERLAIKDAAGNTVISVDYDDENGWPTSPDGGGYSLEIIDPNGNPDDPANWRASTAPNGTPDLPNSAPAPSSIVLNEVMAENLTTLSNGGAFPDWVELYNPGASAVDLSGWSLSDNGNPRRFVLPGGSLLAAGGYLLVFCDTNNAAPGLHAGFALDKDGSSLFLYDANTNRIDAISFGAQLADLTVGRIGAAGGTPWQLNTPTPGAVNLAAATGSATNLAINEWLANAVPGGSDWLEIYNRSATAPVAMGGNYLGTSNAIFQFKSLSFVAPGGFIQLFADELPGPKHLDFKLSAAGGAIVLYDASATEISRVTYGAQAQGVTQGRLPNGAANIVSFPGSASPAASNYVVSSSGPMLNEVLARNESELSPWSEFSDWVEIVNPGASTMDLSGLGLSDSPGSPAKWQFPAGTTLAAGGYLRVWCDASRVPSPASGPDPNTGFSLSGESGGVYLFSAAGVLLDSVEYGFQVADLSLGRSGGQWRLLASPTPGAANAAPAALGNVTALRFNEWSSDPSSGSDWFELFNTSGQPIDLGGLYVTDDPSLAGITQHQIAPLSFIGANGFVRFEADADPSQGRNHTSFGLDDLGDSLRLYAANQTLIDGVDFGPLPQGASGGRLPDGTATLVQFNSTPTPGESNYLPLPDVVVNEALTHTDPPLEDAVELFNSSPQTVNIGGYYLSDSKGNFKKYRIADGTTVPAGGFKVFYENQFNSGAPGTFGFNSARGGSVYLSAADGSGNLTGYRSVLTFGAAKNGVSFGRYPTSVGLDFPAMSARSFGADNPTTLAEFRAGTGAANPAPKVGPIVINEIMYHPISGVAPNLTEDGNEEFIELHNVTGIAVPLFDAMNPANRWRLRGAVEFDFPGGVSLPAKSYLLLVRFNPATDVSALANFRSKYGVALSVPIYGPLAGRLDNSGESVELYLPDTPQGPGPDQGYVPYVLVDKVSYGDSYPWPADADGTGASLQRRRPYQYGNEPSNWKSLAATAGRANVTGSDFTDVDTDGLPDSWELANGLSSSNPNDAALDADGDGHSNLEEYFDGTNPQSAASRLDAPVLSSQPQSQTVIPGATVVFTVNVGGAGAPENFTPAGAPGTFLYQWRFNGLALPGETNATLSLTDVNSASSGFYDAVVWNGAGFVISQTAKLTVLIPPSITLQPQTQVVNPGANATFSVAANGTGLVRYQWRVNGVDLAGETGSSLIVANAQLANEGEYTALISDDVATISSAAVRLVVRVLPTILVPPESVTNVVGSTATFAITCSGSVPMTFIWRKGATGIATNVVFRTTDSLTLTNIQLTDSAQYRVIVTNYAIATLSTNATAFLQVLLPLRLQDMQLLPDGSASMRMSGSTNRTYAIEISSTLTNWTTLTNIFYTNGLMPFIDPTTAVESNRFYRARLP